MYSSAGSRFWKSNKRVRAVKKVEFRRGKAPYLLDTSSDSDFDIQQPAKCKKSLTMEERLTKLEEQMIENSFKQQAEKTKILRKSSKHLNEIRQCFECLICKSIANFPALVSPCCSILLGCVACVEPWLTSSQQCPHCRDALTMQQCSQVPFIRNLSHALNEGSSEDSSSSVQ